MNNVKSFAEATKKVKITSATAEVSAKNQRAVMDLHLALINAGARLSGDQNK